jgi:hypothetical protein
LSRPNRQQELLADRALEGLSEAELRELETLGGAGDDSFDYAAAAAALAELGPVEPMPAALAAKVLADAQRRPANGVPDVTAPIAAPGAAAVRPSTTPPRSGGYAQDERKMRPRWDLGRSAGWLAAAAAVLVAFYGWTRPPRVVEKVVTVEVPAPPPRVPTAAEQREALLAQAADARTIGWSATPDPAAKGATGDVVWSESRQQGYMRIRGLAANDPRRAQYQLWIFDAKRDQATPVDGGVFDVRDGEVVVPIRAAIQVFEPKLFAITVERPGGVVVSKRERIVLTAAL